ncbi:MAG: 50S ribosomal protein L11 methyltransferase [Flavobacteriales bacterium]|tara:strand:+ start:4421 stop:5254 length:834 start_codon:yes stop_codon:yes gene_type:complete
MNYYHCHFELKEPQPWSEILVTYLGELNFESFQNEGNTLDAYIQHKEFDLKKVEEVLKTIDTEILKFTHILIEDENWNAQWEKNFEPIYIDKHCIIRAPFHEKEEGFDYEIIINPQMSFGTGHHQTTYLVMKAMFGIDFENTTVLDMGSGTGILAILAEKLNCKSALAIDIDEWAFQNTIDNIELNSCKKIEVLEGGAELLTEANKYELVLANINRNILVNDMKQYVSSMKKGGIIYMSGFYTSDVSIIQDEAAKKGLTFVDVAEREGWALAQFIKN